MMTYTIPSMFDCVEYVSRYPCARVPVLWRGVDGVSHTGAYISNLARRARGRTDRTAVTADGTPLVRRAFNANCNLIYYSLFFEVIQRYNITRL